jgi:antitoxin component of RelBE/YafQ-DinJ toxin-antitoxin module
MKRNGRPPQTTTKDKTTVTLKIDGELKNLMVSLADGYDMTLTEYVTTLVRRDAEGS